MMDREKALEVLEQERETWRSITSGAVTPDQIAMRHKILGAYDYAIAAIERETMLQGTPSIDAVEVVRCKNCQYRNALLYAFHGYIECMNLKIGRPNVQPNDYCSYGVRQEEEHEG